MNTTAHIHPDTGRIILPKSKRLDHRQDPFCRRKRVLVTDGRLAFALRWRDHLRRKSEARRAHEELAGTVQFVKDLVGGLILAALGYLAFRLAFAL